MEHPSSSPSAPAVPGPGSSGIRAFVLRLGLANLGLYSALLTPVVMTMALRVAEVAPRSKESTLGLVLGVGAMLALIANPLFGRLSDRTRSRFGRRRPWLIGGVAGGVLGLVVVATVPSVPALVAGWGLAQVSFNAVFAALMACIPDNVPTAGRGKASGAIGTSMTGAVLVGTAIAGLVGEVRLMMLLPAVLAVVLVVWFAVRLPDRSPAEPPEPFSPLEFLSSFAFNPRRAPDFGWAWCTKFFVMFGAAAPMSYLAYYVPFRLGATAAETAGIVAVLVGTGYGIQAVTAAFGGWLSDRCGRRKPFVLASGLVVAAGLGLLAYAPNLGWIIAAKVLSSVGGGFYYAVDTALLTQVLPDPDNPAKDLGIVNIANALPQSLMPMIAPVVLLVGGGQNYPLLFAVAAAAAVLGSVLVTRVRNVR